MATASTIKVMLSSRCADRFPLKATKAADSAVLSDIRSALKSAIESARPFGLPLYEVWINEDHTGDGAQPAWDHYMAQAADCDIFIAIYNGHAGWEDTDGSIGICHAELERAHALAPGKVFIVNAHEGSHPDAPARNADRRFQRYVAGLKQFEARNVTSVAALQTAVFRTLTQSTVRLVQRGVEGASIGSNHLGSPLVWSRQNYAGRAASMRASALAALLPDTVDAKADGNCVGRSVQGKPLLFVVSAIPDAMSVAAAREEVGQPHLLDHTLDGRLAAFHGGPVHLVACHKGGTEAQARTMLGFPDATVVSGPFGIYVADPVQSIQIVLIVQCRDDTSTRIGVQRFLAWLDAADQNDELLRLAVKRKAVVKVLADSPLPLPTAPTVPTMPAGPAALAPGRRPATRRAQPRG